MAIHDQYARQTPFELMLPDPDYPARHFSGVVEEAEGVGVDPWNPAAFLMLGSVSHATAELRPEESTSEAVHDHGELLFHAFHFWRSGSPLVLVTGATLRALLDADPEPEGRPLGGLSGRAGYVQLPQHLVWLEADEGVPESVDGFHWTVSPAGVFMMLLTTGLRGDRPGFSVVPVPPQPVEALEEWMSGSARDGGMDFSSRLPGADIDGLVGLRTPAEAIKLAGRILSRWGGWDGPSGSADQRVVPQAEEGEADPREGPEPTSFPYDRLQEPEQVT